MDWGTFWIVLIALFVLVVVGAFVVYRRRADVEIRGPFGSGLKVTGSNEEEKAEARPGVRAHGIRSRSGGAFIEDETGGGVDAEDFDVEDDVIISHKRAGDADPKGERPA